MPYGNVKLTMSTAGGRGRAVPQPRAANLGLRVLMDEARMSNKGLARRVVDLAKARGVATVRCDHTSVLRWLAGEQPWPPDRRRPPACASSYARSRTRRATPAERAPAAPPRGPRKDR